MDINQYNPCEEGTKLVFVSSENGCRHVGNNTNHHCIRKFKIDGDVIPKTSSEERCAYLLLNDTDKRAYYIELKGSDIAKAIHQIENTVKLFRDGICDYMVFPRIIYRTGTHDIQSSITTKWRMKYGNKAVIRSREYTENIS